MVAEILSDAPTTNVSSGVRTIVTRTVPGRSTQTGTPRAQVCPAASSLNWARPESSPVTSAVGEILAIDGVVLVHVSEGQVVTLLRVS